MLQSRFTLSGWALRATRNYLRLNYLQLEKSENAVSRCKSSHATRATMERRLFQAARLWTLSLLEEAAVGWRCCRLAMLL